MTRGGRTLFRRTGTRSTGTATTECARWTVRGIGTSGESAANPAGVDNSCVDTSWRHPRRTGVYRADGTTARPRPGRATPNHAPWRARATGPRSRSATPSAAGGNRADDSTSSSSLRTAEGPASTATAPSTRRRVTPTRAPSIASDRSARGGSAPLPAAAATATGPINQFCQGCRGQPHIIEEDSVERRETTTMDGR